MTTYESPPKKSPALEATKTNPELMAMQISYDGTLLKNSYGVVTTYDPFDVL